MKGHINTSVGKSLLVGYGTNAVYPNTTSTSNFIMLSHTTFNNNIGFNYPNPECGILMTNGSQNGHPWCFYSGVVKYVAATNPIVSLRYDIGNCNINNTLYTMTGTSTFNPSISLLYTGKVGIGTTTPETTLHVSGTTLLNNNTTINGILTVSGNTLLNNNTTINGSLNVSSYTLLNNNTTINGNLNVSGINILTTLSTLFSGSYNDLINKPTLFSGSYTDLVSKPTNFQADWLTTIINKPSTFPTDMTTIYTKD